MASGIYDRFLSNLMNKQVDLVNDTIKVALMDVSHSYSNTDNELADVSANEVSGTGYTTGGKEITGKTVTQGSPTVFNGNDVVWTGITVNAYHAVIYDDTLTNDDLIASIDFGGEVSVSDGTLTIEWDTTGIITLS